MLYWTLLAWYPGLVSVHGMSFMLAIYSRNILLAWATLWMTALPLVHVHADGPDHGHGLPGHAHHGLAHTIFDRDVPGEFAVHSLDPGLTVALEEPIHFDPVEVAFTPAVSGERQNLGVPALLPVSSPVPLLPRLVAAGSKAELFVRPPPSLLLLTSHLPHAPPSSAV